MASSSDESDGAFENFMSSLKKNAKNISNSKLQLDYSRTNESMQSARQPINYRSHKHVDQSPVSSPDEYEDALEDIPPNEDVRAVDESSLTYTISNELASISLHSNVTKYATKAQGLHSVKIEGSCAISNRTVDVSDDDDFVENIAIGRHNLIKNQNAQQKPRSSRFSSSSSDDEGRFEMLVSSLKADRVKPGRGNAISKGRSVASMNSFIVDDDDEEDDSEEQTGSDESSTESSQSEGDASTRSESSIDSVTKNRRLFTQLQLQDDFCRPHIGFSSGVRSVVHVEKKNRANATNEAVPRSSVILKEKNVTSVNFTPQAQKSKSVAKRQPSPEKPEKLLDTDAEFLYKLSADDARYSGNTDEAKKLKRVFLKNRTDIANRVAEIMSRRVFDGKMPMDVVTIEFTKRLLKTAGDTTTRGVIGSRTCRIRLAEKVCDTPGRVRDTLIHELCHGAVGLIDGILHHKHGPLWVKWTRIIAQCFPKLPPVTVCHRYAIQTKYVYACQTCSHHYGRHSKSIDVDNQRCGYCRGVLVLLVQNKSSNNVEMVTPRPDKQKNAWTTFVSENFASIKRELPPKSAHKEVMARLKVMYQSARSVRNVAGDQDSSTSGITEALTPGISSHPNSQRSDVDEIDLLSNTFSASCAFE